MSDLNSAYFIYNSEDPAIRHFQEQRFEVLRKAKGYEDIDQRFMQYYTQFPSDGKYAPIKLLADSIAMHKQSTIDKILGVRDYFYKGMHWAKRYLLILIIQVFQDYLLLLN